MRLALIPINPTVGAIDANTEQIAQHLDLARARGVDLAVFPELCICAYPPKDLLLHEGFVVACEEAVRRIGERHSASINVIIGHPQRLETPSGGVRVANALSVYRDGRRITHYHKRLLPTYDVFDEDRYFTPGDKPALFEVAGIRVGLAVCEDLWRGIDAGFQSRYDAAVDPVGELVAAGAQLVVSPSASPFVLGKARSHFSIVAQHASRHGIAMASVNQYGGNDDLIFDGHAFVYAATGELLASTTPFSQETLTLEIPTGDNPCAAPEVSQESLLFDALVLGVKDYLRKTGFQRALIGLSGGIDSAVTAAIAAAALGGKQLLGVAMPGKYSSDHSRHDAEELARRLGMDYETIPIAKPFTGFRAALDPVLGTLGFSRLGESLPDLSEENLQARTRGTILMTLSNRTGALLLTTGNKSELAVGYCTLYGDMNGGLAVLSDVAKQQVYRLARHINKHHLTCGFATSPIPESTITKPPSAELAPGQRDDNSLPPYELLDEIIERYVEERQSVAHIVERSGFDEAMVRRIARLIDRNEYKRKQTAIGLKVTSVAFGPGRRMPIAQHWRA